MLTLKKPNLLGVSVVGGFVGMLMFLTGVQSSGEAPEQLHLSLKMTVMGWLGVIVIAAAAAVIFWCCFTRGGDKE
ncbi:MAG: hypothetical protein KGJ59_03760 [Bacteroidota bacterium]|nr:hypothetical protein [Bacteroidota bacterium]